MLSRQDKLDLIERLDRRHQMFEGLLRDQFSDLVQADRAELWRVDGCRDMAEWVAGRFGISNWQAHRWVAAAHALEELPATAEAFARGELNVEKVVELTRYATPETEMRLIKWAKRVRPATIRREADLANSPTCEETAEADNQRYLRYWWDIHGMALEIEGRLPAHEGAQFMKAVDDLARKLPTLPTETEEECLEPLDSDEAEERYGHLTFEPGPGPVSSIDARRADALALLAGGFLSGKENSDRSGVVVHVDLRALQEDGGCIVENGPIVHSEIARRLRCDGKYEVFAEDGSRTIGYDRPVPTPAWLRRQVFHRDGGCCTFPGCDMKRFLHAHHIWQRGDLGPTKLDNLITACSFHHKLVHEFRWKVSLDHATGTVDWFRPDGTRYDPGPVLRAPPDPAALALAI